MNKIFAFTLIFALCHSETQTATPLDPLNDKKWETHIKKLQSNTNQDIDEESASNASYDSLRSYQAQQPKKSFSDSDPQTLQADYNQAREIPRWAYLHKEDRKKEKRCNTHCCVLQ